MCFLQTCFITLINSPYQERLSLTWAPFYFIHHKSWYQKNLTPVQVISYNFYGYSGVSIESFICFHIKSEFSLLWKAAFIRREEWNTIVTYWGVNFVLGRIAYVSGTLLCYRNFISRSIERETRLLHEHCTQSGLTFIFIVVTNILRVLCIIYEIVNGRRTIR